MSDYDDHMKEYGRVSEMHAQLARAFEPLVRMYYAKAVNVDPRQFDDMSVHAMVEAHPFTLPRNDQGQIDTWDEKFDSWRRAAVLDTMSRVQEETLGADDSTFDYVPDGVAQIDALVNAIEECEWLEVAVRSMKEFTRLTEEGAPWPTISFQDCTSPILASVLATDDPYDD